MRVCLEDGCPNLCEKPHRRCPTHEKQAAARWRSDHNAFYASKRWAGTRRAVLQAAHNRCSTPGCTRWAEEIDHIIPLAEWQGDPHDRSNLQALCKIHHSMKTAQETIVAKRLF